MGWGLNSSKNQASVTQMILAVEIINWNYNFYSSWNCGDWCRHQISEREWWWFLQCPYLNLVIWLVKSDGPIKWQLITPNFLSDDADCSCSSRCATHTGANRHRAVQWLICNPFLLIPIGEGNQMQFAFHRRSSSICVPRAALPLCAGLCQLFCSPAHNIFKKLHHLITGRLADLWHWW